MKTIYVGMPKYENGDYNFQTTEDKERYDRYIIQFFSIYKNKIPFWQGDKLICKEIEYSTNESYIEKLKIKNLIIWDFIFNGKNKCKNKALRLKKTAYKLINNQESIAIDVFSNVINNKLNNSKYLCSLNLNYI